MTFQCFIDCVLRGLNFSCAYVYDIHIASKNEEEHLQHLQMFSGDYANADWL